jgi:hypothetical protein
MENIERWDRAIKHAKEMLELYKSIPTGGFGVIVIQRDIDLYNNGDRSKALLSSLESIR